MSGEEGHDKSAPGLWAAFWAPGVEEKAIVRRLFLRAAERAGSASALARSLGLDFSVQAWSSLSLPGTHGS